MTVWLLRLGALCVVLGAVLISPLMDLLPADWNAHDRDHEVFFRAVPAPAFGTRVGFDETGAALIVLGLTLVCAGVAVRRTGRHRHPDRSNLR